MPCELSIDGPPSGVQSTVAATTRGRRLPAALGTQVRVRIVPLTHTPFYL